MSKKRVFNVGDVVLLNRWYLEDNINGSYVIDKKYKQHGERTYSYCVSPTIKTGKTVLTSMVVMTRDIRRKLDIEEYGMD